MKNNLADRQSVSVILPTWNGAQWLEAVLSGLEQQTLVPDEIIVVDSGSTDGTLDIVRRHGIRLVEIAQQDFDHGGTRTMAAGLAAGDILVFMTQDAVPAGRDALEQL
ncbi:MAG: glycosyltransferase, partial [Thermodesulfobacteriota bacterium]|nr:glycosyltransferase [Thermodesulfobacteriota bacterium]